MAHLFFILEVVRVLFDKLVADDADFLGHEFVVGYAFEDKGPV